MSNDGCVAVVNTIVEELQGFDNRTHFCVNSSFVLGISRFLPQSCHYSVGIVFAYSMLLTLLIFVSLTYEMKIDRWGSLLFKDSQAHTMLRRQHLPSMHVQLAACVDFEISKTVKNRKVLSKVRMHNAYAHNCIHDDWIGDRTTRVSRTAQYDCVIRSLP